MIDVLATVLICLAVGLAVWSLVLIVMNRPFTLTKPYAQALAAGLLVLELVLIAQFIAGLVNMFGSGRPIDRLTFGGYLFGPVLILPLATVWAAAERTRWGPAALIIGCLAVVVMIVRLQQIWAGNG